MRHFKRILILIMVVTVFFMLFTIDAHGRDILTLGQALFRSMVESIILMVSFMGYKILGGEWN